MQSGDTQDTFIVIRDDEHFSPERGKNDERNSYNFLNKYIANNANLSECDYNIANFKRFIEIVREETLKGDYRPIYVFNYFERLDEATDISPFIDLLVHLGREVFIDVGSCPVERFEKYM